MTHYTLDFSRYHTLDAAIASIPENVTHLHLIELRRVDFARVLAAIPVSVSSLSLSGHDYLSRWSGWNLAEGFAAISVGVRSLSLSHCDFGDKHYSEIARGLAALRENVKSLDLSHNNLHKQSTLDLSRLISRISKNVTSLKLRSNQLGDRSGAELAQIFTKLSARMKVLDLSNNGFGPKDLTWMDRKVLDCGYNGLVLKQLTQALSVLPAGLHVILKGNGLFKDNTWPYVAFNASQRDQIILSLKKSNPYISLDLTDNGESDAQRAVAPLASWTRQRNNRMPIEVAQHVLSFLTPKGTPQARVSEMLRFANEVHVDRLEDEEEDDSWEAQCTVC